MIKVEGRTMLYVITGVSGSGKSEYAENLAVQLAAGKPLYYVATMEPYGQEGQARIARHHKLRAGKGFETIECYRNIVQITDRIGEDRMKEATILLECMSNLLANEMFDKTDVANGDLTDKLLSGMSCISRQCKHLIVVTNEVFADGIEYAPETKEYMRQLGRLNRELVGMADEAVEVVYGIPMGF
ncbi:MAG: bifunctional adenosylcobinamide kinase/adenosylcobinamide-phosphate guanylyltransferase [Lachnospiraceae bacterium]